jgi:uncharacterized membrane protein
LILYALVAFIPLLSPRALILSVPWIVWTFLTISSNFTLIGREYTLIAAGPIFIGLAHGLDRTPLEWVGVKPQSRPDAPIPPEAAVDRRAQPAPRPRRRWPRSAWVGVIVAVVIANSFLMPINPALTDLGVKPGSPFVANYFDHSLRVTPGFEWVEKLVSIVPYSATIVSPSTMFPRIANYPHA